MPLINVVAFASAAFAPAAFISAASTAG